MKKMLRILIGLMLFHAGSLPLIYCADGIAPSGGPKPVIPIEAVPKISVMGAVDPEEVTAACRSVNYGYSPSAIEGFFGKQIIIEGGSEESFRKGMKLAVFRRGPESVTYVGQIEVWATSANNSVCDPLTVVPGISFKEGDKFLPVDELSLLFGRVERTPSNDAIEVLFDHSQKKDRLRVYRETPTGIVECGQLKVLTANKNRAVCKVMPGTLKTAIQPGDRVTQMARWAVQWVDNDLVTIPVGTEDGLAKGNRLVVVRRSGCYGAVVGRIEVIQADADRCVCRIFALKPELVVENGDIVVRERPPPKDFNFKGAVVAIPQDGMVEVNIGSDHELAKGDRLKVLRTTDGQTLYVGQVTVVRTDHKNVPLPH